MKAGPAYNNNNNNNETVKDVPATIPLLVPP